MIEWNVLYDPFDENQERLYRGREIYRHPKGYFVTLEFQGKGGCFRECFKLCDLLPVISDNNLAINHI